MANAFAKPMLFSDAKSGIWFRIMDILNAKWDVQKGIGPNNRVKNNKIFALEYNDFCLNELGYQN